MLDSPTADWSPSREEVRQFESACDAFERALRAGQQPNIEQFLAEAPASMRKQLLDELVTLDKAYRDAAPRAETDGSGADSVGGSGDDPVPSPSGGAPWPQLPGYEIVAELGRGGMGVVYKAYQLAAKRFVALKMIRDGVLAGAGHRTRFRIEAEAAARFQHPNLVQIHEVGEQAGLPYFSMELAEGGSLDRKLAGQPLPPRDAAELVRTLADAVQYAHDKKIVHRDLKPANVVLTADNRPLITDFGLAKRLDSDTLVTGSEGVLGTASYMAPEQATGPAQRVGPPADVYALGAILYELLTGRPPFRGDDYQDTVRQVVQDEPVPPTQLRPEVPIGLETICLKCLEKVPADRYASARALADDLARFLAGESIAAAPLSEWERQARWAVQAGFEIDEVLTYGVRDAVYKALQVHNKRPVALKVFAAPAQPDPAARARLREYAETVARLAHPCIVGIYMSGDLHGRTYLAFEYVPGGSLIEHYLDQPLPPREAARLVQQLAEAVQHAHERGVLHLALKPSNVLLSADGTPKITNFALRQLFDLPSSQRRALRRLPSYMAPELADGRSADLGPVTDVYGLGAILYKLLTGGPPFLAETFDETLEQVRTRRAPDPSSVRPDVPFALDVVCQNCLAKEPRERYPRAADLAEDLGRFLAADRPAGPVLEARPQFPSYELLRELGRGSMSVVYEALQTGTDERVALKVMSPQFRYGPALRAMLWEVSERVSRLRHPNVVQVHECGEERGRPYLVTEHLPGGSLDQRRTVRMSIREAALLVRTLARTMEDVHRQNIIHGNLKPSKVLFAADGTPKITGFMIARQQQDSVEPAGSQSGRAEAVGGQSAAIGPATDIYALGLILYELLTGWLPFRSATLWEMMSMVLRGESPEPPGGVRSDVPPDLDTICLRCLARNPDERYSSAGALAADLDQFLAGEPLALPSSSEQPRVPGDRSQEGLVGKDVAASAPQSGPPSPGSAAATESGAESQRSSHPGV